MEFLLDGRRVDSRQMLHRLLAEGLGFPAWYGGNLDALHDCLLDLAEPTTLTILREAALRQSLGGYAAAFFHVLEDSTLENPNLTVFREESSSVRE